MSTPSNSKQPYRRGAVMAMSLGLLLTVVTLVASIIDQASLHSIADHVQALYAPYNLHPDPSLLFTIVYMTGSFGIIMWLATIRGVVRQKRWPRYVAVFLCLAATSAALLNLLAAEYGTRIFPTVWGVLGLLPCIAGLVAVVLMWTPGRAVQTQS
jgi:hypothetical protein